MGDCDGRDRTEQRCTIGVNGGAGNTTWRELQLHGISNDKFEPFVHDGLDLPGPPGIHP